MGQWHISARPAADDTRMLCISSVKSADMMVFFNVSRPQLPGLWRPEASFSLVFFRAARFVSSSFAGLTKRRGATYLP
jgi:hypothetical protein